MKLRTFLFLLLIISILSISGCGKKECKADTDCFKAHYTSTCVDRLCVHTPIPGECGNGLCEDGENKCSCPSDCGPCMGSAGANLELTCVEGQCIEGVPPAKVKPITSSEELSASGDKIRLTSTYNQPFNMARDFLNIRLALTVESKYNANRKISQVVLEGVTADKRTVVLADEAVNRNLWPGQEVNIDLVLDFTTALKEGLFKDLTLKLNYDYDYISGSTVTPKTLSLKKDYRGINFGWVKPSTEYPCPTSCDDNNPGTQDICDASTGFFCRHIPVPGACGNYVCESSEDRCTCPQDCGPCSGDVGSYMQYACVQNKCTAQPKQGISVSPASIFDDRKMSDLHMQNNYVYNNPFNVGSDSFNLNFNLYDKKETTTNIKITNVRLFEGTNEIASSSQVLLLQNVGSSGSITVTVPPQPMPEMDKSITIKVWYEYEEGGETVKSSYTKALEKITFLTPK